MQAKKIIWAVDPFEAGDEGKESALRRRSISLLRTWAERAPVEIEAVYLLSPLELNIAVDIQIPQKTLLLDKYREAAETALDRLASGTGISQITSTQVLIEPSSSLRHSVERIADYAEEKKADFIFVASHGRSGLQRLLLGSFAETLILHSRIPTMVIGGHSKSETFDLKKIVFATDLGPFSRALFEEAVQDAKQLGCELALFHALPNPVEPVLQSGMYLLGGGWVPMHQFFAEDAEIRRKQLTEWAEFAKGQGVSCNWRLEEIPGNISDAIVDFAKSSGASIVAMAAQSGPVASALIGSIVRQVVRQAVIPVLILHPRPTAEPAAGEDQERRTA